MNILLAALSIFVLRLLDQTLGTLRILYVNKGKPGFVAILGFIASRVYNKKCIIETKLPEDNRIKAYKVDSSIIKKKISFYTFLFRS